MASDASNTFLPDSSALKEQRNESNSNINNQSIHDPWLSGPQVDGYLGISHQTRWRWVKNGKLPKGIEFSTNSKRWRKSWIDEAINSLVQKAF